MPIVRTLTVVSRTENPIQKGLIEIENIKMEITNKPVMLTIKEAAALVGGLSEYRVRELC